MQTLQITNNQFEDRTALDVFARTLEEPVILEIGTEEAKRLFVEEGTIIYNSRVSVV